MSAGISVRVQSESLFTTPPEHSRFFFHDRIRCATIPRAGANRSTLTPIERHADNTAFAPAHEDASGPPRDHARSRVNAPSRRRLPDGYF